LHAIALVQLPPQVEAKAVPTVMASTTTTSKLMTSRRFTRDLRCRSHSSVNNWRAIEHSSGSDLSDATLAEAIPSTAQASVLASASVTAAEEQGRPHLSSTSVLRTLSMR
jgi:hypothetical protein